jgi:catechol 2,3-dioxygenase-like lactoylglutathione lyase family enzyme
MKPEEPASMTAKSPESQRPENRSDSKSRSMFKISETILKTGQLDLMKTWYRRVLGVDVLFEHTPGAKSRPGDFGGQTRASDLRMCFFRISAEYPYTQMIGLFEEPGLAPTVAKNAPGLHHMQFMMPDLESLVQKYEDFASTGLRPHRATNHGVMMSFYYRDPDGNNVEFSAQNFPSLEVMNAFMQGDYFRKNPSGVEISDADEFVARYRSGVPVAELTRLE